MLPVLPPEALRSIVEKLWNDQKTIRSILLTSRQFYEVAEPVLFGTALFLPSQIDALNSFLKAIKASDGRRGTFVRFLTFFITGYVMHEFELIDQILMQTPNLHTLFFRRYVPIENPPLDFLHNAPFALRELNLFDSIFDQHMADFLDKQMKLEELNILSEEDIPVMFSPAAFPNLKTFTFSNLNIFRRILCTSARPTHLSLVGYNKSFTSPPHLTQPQVNLACVRVFAHCLHRDYPPDILLSFTQPLFTNLEFLDINALRECIDVPSFLDAICDSAHNRTLLGVRFTLLDEVAHPPDAPPPQIEIPPRCFDAMPRLRFVEFTGDGGKQQRVYRDSRAPVAIRWKIAHSLEWLGDWEKDVEVV